MIQFSLQNFVAANTTEFSMADRMQVVSSLQNWGVALSVLSQTLSREDMVFLKARLQEAGLDKNSPLKINLKGGSLYLDKVKLTVDSQTKEINYKGHVIRYSREKSFTENYQETLNQLRHNYSLRNLIIPEAEATEKSDNAKEFASTAAFLTLIAFLFDAPAWVIVAGIAATVLFAAMAIAYADEMTSPVKDFKCSQDGYSIYLRDGYEIKTIVSGQDVSVQKIQNGKIELVPKDHVNWINKVAPLAKKACDSGGSAAAEFKKALVSGTNTTKKENGASSR